MIKKILFFGLTILLFSCSSNENLANCIRTLPLNLNTDLNNPQLINAQTPGGHADINGGTKGILLFNKNGNDFVAFDKLCPNNDCDNAMIFENRLLKCTCDESTYSVDFGGAPQTDNAQCPAIQYQVFRNGTAIRITNF
ncbi:phosphoribosylaminoimidazole carboxylase [Polaribacter porphyrae]|uniref:Rieske domain-containing protein n=1 Tax=Polaribacter porphyrae TaxID=1137780 RepID=A0A2S7WPY3_9FLAO|nr:phosphoribosylaminoimidazole carboxylase [Polaribacter porphyrae]PQJ79670.1 hypothetical protein BTO18_11020 [Polaribacter porphyrae]